MMRAAALLILAVVCSSCADFSSGVNSFKHFVKEQTAPDSPDVPKTIAPAKAKDLPPISPTFAESLIAHRKVDHVVLKVFDTGSAAVDGDSVSTLKSRESRIILADPVFLIEHPVQGLILFDTGLGAYRPTPLFQNKPGQDIVSQLKSIGINPDQIKIVISSHLHYDHAGMISAFPKARWLVDLREWRAARAAQGIDAEYLDLQTLAGQLPEVVDLSSAPTYGAFDHGRDLFGDGTMILLDLSGHTAGNLGLWLNMDEGPVLLTGGAAAVWDNYNDLALPAEPHVFDLREYKRRLQEIHVMEQLLPDLMIVPSHDLSPLRLLPRDDISRAGG